MKRLLLLPLLFTLAACATAQPVARSFTDLQPALPSGKKVRVTDTAGRMTLGTIAEISQDSVVILTREEVRDRNGSVHATSLSRQSFSDTQVAEIRGPDPLWNGGLIGFAVGLGAAGAFVFTPGCQDNLYNGRGSCPAAVPNLLLLGGMAAGMMIDRATLSRLFYLAPGATRRSSLLSPMLGRQSRGVTLSMRF
jgi:hypothetical protein